MRGLIQATRYKKDLKREMKGQYKNVLEDIFTPILEALMNDRELAPRLHDHALGGDWNGFRDCHIRPDLVLIYRKVGDVEGVLELVRLGSHSELGI